MRAAAITGAVLSAFAVTGDADAQSDFDPAHTFCDGRIEKSDDVVDNANKRQSCAREWQRSAHMIGQYLEQTGYISEEGGFSAMEALKRSFSPRVFIGLPPKDPYLRCVGKVVGNDFFQEVHEMDFPAIWSCLVKRDPLAARMDTI